MSTFERILDKRHRVAAQGRAHARGFAIAALVLLVLALASGQPLVLDLCASPALFFAGACAFAAGAACAISLVAGATCANFLRYVWTPPTGFVLLTEMLVARHASSALAPAAVFAPLPAVPRRASHR